jgi:hypothetical protein
MTKKSIIEDAYDNAATIHPEIKFDRERLAAYLAEVKENRAAIHGTGVKPFGIDYIEGQRTPDLDAQLAELPRPSWPIRTALGVVYIGAFGALHYAFDVQRQLDIENAHLDAA